MLPITGHEWQHIEIENLFYPMRYKFYCSMLHL